MELERTQDLARPRVSAEPMRRTGLSAAAKKAELEKHLDTSMQAH